MVEDFQVTRISGTTVTVTWQHIESDAVDRYTVYYYSTSEVKRQVDLGSKNFSANVSEGVVDGLDPNLDYIFSITVTFILGGIEYEGEETDPIIPIGNVVWILIYITLRYIIIINVVILTITSTPSNYYVNIDRCTWISLQGFYNLLFYF